MSMKNSNDTIGNRTRELPACSAVLQPNGPPAACSGFIILNLLISHTGLLAKIQI
jgi:hypothetical protein